MEITEKEFELENKSLRFDREWVQVLINLRLKYAKSFTGKRNSAIIAWNDILKEMHNLGAPKSTTRLRIKKKWMNLMAKYKHLKSDGDVVKQNAWAYFEQIDRAYLHKTNEDVINTHSTIRNHDVQNGLKIESTADKELFMRTLIDLRCKYSNLFTGRKYASQKGWMEIRNYLPNGDKYTIEQISKIWHNLLQRYKTLVESEVDHNKITWVYFQQLNEMLSKTNNETTSNIELSIIQSKEGAITVTNDDPIGGDGMEISKVNPVLMENINKRETPLDENNIKGKKTCQHLNQTQNNSNLSLNDLFNYLKAQDIKRDLQMTGILKVMQEIVSHLK